jgi:hypothetical protein
MQDLDIYSAGHIFGASVALSGPGDPMRPVYVRFYIHQSSESEGISFIGADCASEAEVREQIGKLKADLDWLEKKVVRKIRTHLR